MSSKNNIYGVPFVSKLYINLECNIMIAGFYKMPTNIYKSPPTFINHSVNLYVILNKHRYLCNAVGDL